MPVGILKVRENGSRIFTRQWPPLPEIDLEHEAQFPQLFVQEGAGNMSK